MGIDEIGDFLGDCCPTYDSAIQAASSNLTPLGGGSHSTVFSVEGAVLKISENPHAFNAPSIPKPFAHLEQYLVPYFGHGEGLNYNYAFQVKGKLLNDLEPTNGHWVGYYTISSELVSADIASPSWDWGEWSNYEITLDVCQHNAGIFNNSVKFFDY